MRVGWLAAAWENRDGVVSMEYGLLAATLMVAITVGVAAIGSETGALFKTITVELCRANHTRICVLPP